ncbi:nischarin [Anthonomus grandis grandis]|uniref:nischarin n=1 Tax=Anthonomus grandis grandis TaxID=2921223 RepID=UPI00216608E0|nr:nischarin [Anthonomus grandis grandis]
MSFLWYNQKEINIEIPLTEEYTNITYYIIQVTVGEIKWKVKHRYNDFYTLHNKLVIDHGVSKDILPSKKVIGNKTNQFIEMRKKGLEEYLQRILVFLKRTMPKTFVHFLDFHLYDIYFLLQDLSLKCFAESDFVLSSTKSLNFTPLEFHAISEFLKCPIPGEENLENPLDLGPILDLCSQLRNLTVTGSFKEYLQSNIILNKLPFEFSFIKLNSSLNLKSVSLEMITSLGNLRETLKSLKVCYTNAKYIYEVLQCDVLHKSTLEGSERWLALETLDLSNNNLIEIDKTISLAINLKTLILDGNKISTISNLTSLPKLEYLSIINNLITICDQLHTKVGNIKTLNLSQNSIVTTKGFFKLYSLENLDLSCNKLCDIEQLEYLGNLPCIENLRLTGNNVSTTVDYRVRVLGIFGDKARNICLDNERPSQPELDKVSILNALKIVKEGKTPDLEGSLSA